MLKIAFFALSLLVSAISFAAPTIKDYGSLPNTSMMSIRLMGKPLHFEVFRKVWICLGSYPWRKKRLSPAWI